MTYEKPSIRFLGTVDHFLRQLNPPQKQKEPDIDQRVMKLMRFVDDRSGRIYQNLDAACRELKMEVSGEHAARLFKRHTGFGLRQYAKQKRLAAAADLLANTPLSVKEIAAELGYQTPINFYRRFKGAFGLAPTAFRQQRKVVGEDHNTASKAANGSAQASLRYVESANIAFSAAQSKEE
jgi:AraC-like DNA-binding protein